MNTNKKNLQLPSNRNFGLFFSIIFSIISFYFYLKDNFPIAFLFIFIALIFFIVVFTKPKLLRPLNRMWMKLGTFLGRIVSPLILGLIFFSIFTPVGIIMRLLSRDELLLRFKNKKSYWQNPLTKDSLEKNFKNQF